MKHERKRKQAHPDGCIDRWASPKDKMKNLLLILTFLLFRQGAIAQQTDLAESRIDSLIQNFIHQNSVILSSGEVIGLYTFSEGFWSESIELKKNGKFKIVDSACLGNAFVDKGTWEVDGNTIQLTSKNGKLQVAYLIQRDEQIAQVVTTKMKKFVSSDGSLKSFNHEEDIVFIISIDCNFLR